MPLEQLHMCICSSLKRELKVIAMNQLLVSVILNIQYFRQIFNLEKRESRLFQTMLISLWTWEIQ